MRAGGIAPGASTAFGLGGDIRVGFSTSLLGALGPGASAAFGFGDISVDFSTSLLGALGPGASTAFGFGGDVRVGFSTSLLGLVVSTLFGFSFSSRACCWRAREAAVLFGSNLGGSVVART